MTRLATDKSIVINKNEKLLSYLSKTITSGILITDKLLKEFPPIFLCLALDVKEAILKYFIRDSSELLSFVGSQERKVGVEM